MALITLPAPAAWAQMDHHQHHIGALRMTELVMAHAALNKSSNPTIQRLARQEILALRRMLQRNGLHKPEYALFEALFSF